MTPRHRGARAAASVVLFLLSVAVLTAGCSDSGLNQLTSPDMAMDMAVPAQTIQVTLSGGVTGRFPAVMTVQFNLPAAPGKTFLGVITGRSPGLGIESFALNGTLGGPPDVGHYTEMSGQLVASLKMTDGREYDSNINSLNRLDLDSAKSAGSLPDKSEIYTVHGQLAGSALSTVGGEVVNFNSSF